MGRGGQAVGSDGQLRSLTKLKRFAAGFSYRQRMPRTKILLLIPAALAALLPGIVQAQTAPARPPEKESNLTFYAGYRFGGELTDVATDDKWEVTEGGSYAVAADFGLSRNTQWELFVSHRSADLKASGLFSPVVNDFGLDITYYHIGGTYFPEQVGRGFYVVGGLGATRLSPQQSGLDSETRFSFNIGGGYMIPATKHVGIRLEARGFVTLLDSSGGMFCSGGCVVQVKGTTMTQGELSAGLAVRF